MWICSQLGAREHFAVPRALRQDGQLAALYTDFWAGPVTRGVWKQCRELNLENRKGRAIEALRSMASRYHSDLRGGQSLAVRSWNLRALGWEMILRNRKSGGGNQYHGFIEVGRRFATRVREDLKRRSEVNPEFLFFAYDTGALEALEWCREQGVKCVLNQMDPNRVETDLVHAEEKLWPGWVLQSERVPEEYFARREQEWAAADRIVVNSEFSRQALVQQGVAAEKLTVIPLSYEPDQPHWKSEIRIWKSDQPLRVLFLGQVILRKGIQYLIAAARQLERENIHFDVVGSIGISPAAMATAPANMTFHGRTGRDEAARWYRQSHVFVLPTLSDGFALTQLEAMAQGLPVIATPCCGTVVSDGVDGFVIPARDAGLLAHTLQRYLSQPELVASQSAAATVKAGRFTLNRLGTDLKQLAASLECRNTAGRR